MSDSYEATIGLEVHAELKTLSKMFCACKNDSDEKTPNVNICPICMAHPGTLPVINSEAVRHLVSVGRAVGGRIADFTEFDRKNYFYPDIPKGYQISQYKYPIVEGGELHGVKLTRVHLEEDTARSTHDKGDHSLIDFNRAGVPLMELVTEPVVKSAEEASAFAKELQLLLRTLGASEANMEKGEMRVEANISVGKGGVLGTKVEVKNLNSFKVVEKAIRHEIERHVKVLDEGGKIMQETRGWDEDKNETFSQREKESSHDYRYFPDPDLPKLKLGELKLSEGKILELPKEKRKRYKNLNLKDEDIEIFVQDASLAAVFDNVAEYAKEDLEIIRLAGNYIISDIVRLIRNPEIHGNVLNITAFNFLTLMKMIEDGAVSSRGAKDILSEMYQHGGVPQEIALKKNLLQKSDVGELKEIAKKVVAANERAVAEYRAGKEASLKFLVGQGMKESRGAANPEALQKAILELLS